MFGATLVRAFETVKDEFDPAARLNPGKIVRPYKMDDPDLMRFAPDYRVSVPVRTGLDWSEKGGFGGAVEIVANSNGILPQTGGRRDVSQLPRHPRRTTPDPRAREHVAAGHFRSTRPGRPHIRRDEADHVALRRVQGVPPRMPDRRGHGQDEGRRSNTSTEAAPRAQTRATALQSLPHYAPLASRLRALANLRDRVPGLPWLSERALGLSARRPLPKWQSPWREGGSSTPANVRGDGLDLVLFADTFNRYFQAQYTSRRLAEEKFSMRQDTAFTMLQRQVGATCVAGGHFCLLWAGCESEVHAPRRGGTARLQLPASSWPPEHV